jgi:hypothetical protein
MQKQSSRQVPDTVIDNAVIRNLNRFTRMGRYVLSALKRVCLYLTNTGAHGQAEAGGAEEHRRHAGGR